MKGKCTSEVTNWQTNLMSPLVVRRWQRWLDDFFRNDLGFHLHMQLADMLN